MCISCHILDWFSIKLTFYSRIIYTLEVFDIHFSMGFLQRCHERRNVSSFSFYGQNTITQDNNAHIQVHPESKDNVKNLALLISTFRLMCVSIYIDTHIYTYASNCFSSGGLPGHSRRPLLGLPCSSD